MKKLLFGFLALSIVLAGCQPSTPQLRQPATQEELDEVANDALKVAGLQDDVLNDKLMSTEEVLVELEKLRKSRARPVRGVALALLPLLEVDHSKRLDSILFASLETEEDPTLFVYTLWIMIAVYGDIPAEANQVLEVRLKDPSIREHYDRHSETIKRRTRDSKSKQARPSENSKPNGKSGLGTER